VLQWFAPAAVVLIFFLQFFTWVGIMPGGVPALTQGAWSAAFASWTREVGTDSLIPFDTKQVEPVASGFLIPYILLFLPTLAVTVAIVVLPFLHIPLPPAVQKLLPYRWGIAAVLNLLVFFFLVVQLLVGFNLENKVADYAVKQAGETAKGKTLTTAEELQKQAQIGETKEMVKRTIWLQLAVLLHIMAVIGASLMYWLTLRGDSRPLPRFEFAY
jgi:hypothetical protein